MVTWNFSFFHPSCSLFPSLLLFLRNPEAKGGKLGFALHEGEGGVWAGAKADIRSITTGGQGGEGISW